ncbi:DegT/DnrJ/EryC1/StrS family aminotransferase [Thalassotalea sp. G2M2-11]|uniref:DegT/DnrJ/EryC1/StrS family aminotransferase n=1 Tax=Thalassotalea sp. G2M2-11 TaxID=2787627 RepID=UPI0019D09F14|nr:DegT/DnrJ/EryC1/StrS family aminotransferase [Thalassotalea sp. G2M2-11]
MFYELATPTFGEEEHVALKKVIDSGFFTMGQYVEKFEQQFAAYHDKKYAVMVNSGSSANLIATAALCFKKDSPLKPGDEVIVPAISWATTYHPLQQYGLKLKFVDVELDSLNIDVSALEDALTAETKMIVGVSILGNPAALDVIESFAKHHGLYFLEDNCESLDAELNGRKAGTFGDIGTFSFFFSHHISTMEGGMLVTDNEELYQLALSLRNHGWTRGQPDNSLLFEKQHDDFNEAYRFILPGYNVRPGELHAVVGIEQLAKLPEFTKIRRKNLGLFQQLFGQDPRFITQQEHGKSSAFCFPMIVKKAAGISREQVFEALKKADIGYRMITGGNFLRHDAIKYFNWSSVGEMTNADYAHDYGFFIGNHPVDLAEQLNTLHQILGEL